MTGRTINISKSIEDLSRKAAELFTVEAGTAIAARGVFSVALSGGSTPAPFYSLLSSEYYRARIDWKRIHFFWTDERCVAKDHPDSNFGMAFNMLLSKVPVPDANIHRIPGELDPEEAASAYDRDLRTFFGNGTLPRFDLVYLGVGTDGHTASIFPGEKPVSDISETAVPVYVEKLGSHRISLTIPVLNNAAAVVFLVTGKSKAGIVRDIIEVKKPELPAAWVIPANGKSIWLLDLDAAGLLADSAAT